MNKRYAELILSRMNNDSDSEQNHSLAADDGRLPLHRSEMTALDALACLRATQSPVQEEVMWWPRQTKAEAASMEIQALSNEAIIERIKLLRESIDAMKYKERQFSPRPPSTASSNSLDRLLREAKGAGSPQLSPLPTSIVSANMLSCPPSPPSKGADRPTRRLTDESSADHPTEFDVLNGRGQGVQRHPGNAKYRTLVYLNKGLYAKCPRADKMKISKGIVAAVRELGGRFLELDERTGIYHDIGDKKAYEKTSQALREGQTKIRKELHLDSARIAQNEFASDLAPETMRAEGYLRFSVGVLRSLHNQSEGRADSAASPIPSLICMNAHPPSAA